MWTGFNKDFEKSLFVGVNNFSHCILYFFCSLLMNHIDKYRTSDIHDVVEIRRRPETGFDPEPDTLAKVYYMIV